MLYRFRVVLPPIIRSAYNCIYSIWYLSHRYFYLPLSWKSWNWFECAVGGVSVPVLPRYQQIAVTVWQIPDVVDTVVCAPDDGWWYYPKHVEQFPDKINCVKLHLVGYIWEQPFFFIKTSQLMLNMELSTLCSKIHTEHINTICGKNKEI